MWSPLTSGPEAAHAEPANGHPVPGIRPAKEPSEKGTDLVVPAPTPSPPQHSSRRVVLLIKVPGKEAEGGSCEWMGDSGKTKWGFKP